MMEIANEKGPGVQTGAGNHEAGQIKRSGLVNTVVAAKVQFVIRARFSATEASLAAGRTMP